MDLVIHLHHPVRAKMHTLQHILRISAWASLLGATGLAGQTIASSQPASATMAESRPSVSNSVVEGEARTSQFILGPADIIRINVWKNTDLSQTVTIGPDGFISLPLLGDVHVVGMTANTLARELKSKLSSFVMNAQVTVSVVDIRSRQVFVTGQVGKPGGYPLVAPISVLQLIAQAGGLNTFANRKEIVILRSAGNRPERLKFNYNNAVRGDPKQNIGLQPGDTVIVP